MKNYNKEEITKIDLSDFKAKLVKNDEPFNIPNTGSESFEFVTYYYGPKYVDKYLLKSNGLFIEFHDFVQTMTPLHPEAGGFIILAKKKQI